MIHKCRMGDEVTIGEGVVIDEDVVLGSHVFIGHNTVIRSGVRISSHVVIGHLVVIERDTFIGGHTTIQSQCHITAEAEIGEYVYFGPCATVINERKITAFRHHVTPQNLQGPKIGNGARIGTRALIMPGVTIGKNAVVAAGAIITKDVGDGEIWMGQAAKYQGPVSQKELI